MSARILFIGEIVGKAGVYCIKTLLPSIVREHRVNFVIADGEGATGGFGIGKNHAIYLHKLGVDVITGGECIYYKKDMVEHIDRARYVLRPANYPPGTPGKGWRVYEKAGLSVGVIVLLGQSGFSRVHLSNPYSYLPELVTRVKEQTNIVIVEFHAMTTAEKATMFYHADGMVSAVIGTHTKVMTADERVLAGGTGCITDAGRTGSQMSVGGLDPAVEIEKFRTQVPERSKDAWDALELQAVLLDISGKGTCERIQRLKIPCKEAPNDRDRNNQ